MIASALTCAVCSAISMVLPVVVPVTPDALCVKLMEAVAGSAAYDAISPLTAALFGRGSPPGDPVLAALRSAHLDALGAVLADFDVASREQTGASGARAKRVASLLRDYVAKARSMGFAERAGAWAGPGPAPATAAALFAPLPDLLSQTLARGAAATAADPGPAMLAEMLDLAGVEERAEALEEIFLHPDTGWLARFVANTRTALARTPEFARLWTAEQLAQMRDALAGIAAGVARIEARLDTMEDAAERRHRETLASVAALKGVDPADLAPILARLGHADVPLADIPRVLAEAVETLRTQGREPVEVHNDAPLIDHAIAQARSLLGRAKAEAAIAVIDAALAADDGYERALAAEADATRHRIAMAQGRARALFERAAIQRATYDHAGARASLEAGLALDPDATWPWLDLGDLHRTLGDLPRARAAYDGAHASTTRQLAQDPSNSDAQRCHSVALERVGDVQAARGDLAAAETSYRKGLRIRARLVAKDPGNAAWLRDLSVAHERIGEVQAMAGALDAALSSFSDGIDIARRLVEHAPDNAGWQHDLGISHHKIGDLLAACGQARAALEHHEAGLCIAQDLAARAPDDTDFQSGLAVAHDRIGDFERDIDDTHLALQHYSTARDIRHRLAARDPANTGWQRDLSVSLNKIGDLLVAAGAVTEALDRYQAALAIRSRLAADDPHNAAWLRDLGVSHNKVGDVWLACGAAERALDSYRASHDILAALAARDPQNVAWQRDLIVANVKIAGAIPGEARGMLAEALVLARGLHETNRLPPVDAWMVPELTRRLAALG